MMALLNLLIPLVFILSIIMVVYCIALFVARKSKQSKIKALKLIIIPLLCIGGVLIYSKHKLDKDKNHAIVELAGKYIYQDSSSKVDSIGQHPIEFTLFENKTFIFKNINLQDSIIRGNWDIDNFMVDIKFTDLAGAVLTHGYKKILRGTTFIILNDNKQKMYFRKIE